MAARSAKQLDQVALANQLAMTVGFFAPYRSYDWKAKACLSVFHREAS